MHLGGQAVGETRTPCRDGPDTLCPTRRRKGPGPDGRRNADLRGVNYGWNERTDGAFTRMDGSRPRPTKDELRRRALAAARARLAALRRAGQIGDEAVETVENVLRRMELRAFLGKLYLR